MPWLIAFDRGSSCPIWLTFNQAKEAGGHFKKAEKGTSVVYANTFEQTETDAETGEETKEHIRFLESYTVLNAEQVEGLPGHYYALAQAPKHLTERLDTAEAFFDATGIDTRHGGNRAFYSPSNDFIQLPPYDRFESREHYYATRCHESSRATMGLEYRDSCQKRRFVYFACFFCFEYKICFSWRSKTHGNTTQRFYRNRYPDSG